MAWQQVVRLEAFVAADNVRTDDGGLARIVDLGGHPRVWVAVTSFLDGQEGETDRAKLEHPEIERLVGKHVRVTVEVYE